MSTLCTFWDAITPYRTDRVRFFGGLGTQQLRSSFSDWILQSARALLDRRRLHTRLHATSV